MLLAVAYRIKPRGEKNAKLGKACLASEGTCSIKASASNGTQRKQQSKSFSKFRKGFSKGFCPKEVPQRAAQQGDQPIACTREVDKKVLPIKSPAVSHRLCEIMWASTQQRKQQKYTEPPRCVAAVQGGARHWYRKYGLLRLERISCLKEVVGVRRLAFFPSLGGVGGALQNQKTMLLVVLYKIKRRCCWWCPVVVGGALQHPSAKLLESKNHAVGGGLQNQTEG